ncbi:hypothetical protein M0R45_002164 [Rubus argutus]|uniref:Uncharacterized protein n=1 Tax=Rubus argutus TaxID=59490 RepID=A0AAW1VJR3_RUBAR
MKPARICTSPTKGSSTSFRFGDPSSSRRSSSRRRRFPSPAPSISPDPSRCPHCPVLLLLRHSRPALAVHHSRRRCKLLAVVASPITIPAPAAKPKLPCPC